MKTLRQIYRELMKEHKYVSQNDFFKYCYAYKNGECKQFTSPVEAQNFSNNIEYVYDVQQYKEAVQKSDQIESNAEQEIKRLIKERLGIVANDKLDNALFELAFKLGEREFDNNCEIDNFAYDDKDELFLLVELYYIDINEHLSKDKLKLILKD